MPLLPRYELALEVFLLVLAACLAAVGVSSAVRLALDDEVPPPAPIAAPAAPAPSGLEDYAVIAARDVFNPGAGSGDAGGGRLRLWGVGLFGGEARAVIEDVAARRQDLYRVGDEVGGVRIAAIDWDRVTVTRGGVEETIALSPTPATAIADAEPAPAPAPADTPPIQRTSANAFVVDRRELAGTFDDMSGLLTQLRAVAEVQDGRPVGFRLFRIRDDSIFTRLGLLNGDVVQRVNGNTVGDPAALLAFVQRLRSEPRVAVDIVRGGEARTLVYDLR
jgi:general secretion pathway protein C